MVVGCWVYIMWIRLPKNWTWWRGGTQTGTWVGGSLRLHAWSVDMLRIWRGTCMGIGSCKNFHYKGAVWLCCTAVCIEVMVSTTPTIIIYMVWFMAEVKNGSVWSGFRTQISTFFARWLPCWGFFFAQWQPGIRGNAGCPTSSIYTKSTGGGGTQLSNRSGDNRRGSEEWRTLL